MKNTHHFKHWLQNILLNAIWLHMAALPLAIAPITPAHAASPAPASALPAAPSAPAPALGDGLQRLEHFLRSAQAGQADFTQTVTAPARDGQPPRVRTSRGTFAFQRPGQWRFDYTQPFAQVIVADGKNIWFHDEDLNQVTQSSQASALADTPAALLASARELRTLQKDFTLTAAPEADGLHWVVATPRQGEGTLRSVRVGFAGPTLAVLEMTDNFGQHSRIQFENLRILNSLPEKILQFQIPQGAEVLKK